MNATTSRRNYGRIDTTCGMGGFLNPPTHPEHTVSVRSSYGDTFRMSLSAAAACEWLNSATRLGARAILRAWVAPAIDSPEVVAWVRQVLGYFAGCYSGHGDDVTKWSAENLRIDSTLDPMLNVDIHAGVHLIRAYYPDFAPTAEDFKLARWGT